MTNEQITVSRELLRQALEWIEAQPEPRMIGAAKISGALRAALEQPAVEPVAWAYLFNDDGSLCQTFDTLGEAENWAASSDNLWSGFIAPLYTAPQAQQPDARTAAIQECIDRLIKGGKPAEAGMLRHHFVMGTP